MATRQAKNSPRSAKRRSGAAVADRGVYGEGNYQASREYNRATRDFVTSGRVPEAARRAAPSSRDEAASLERAERAGRSRARGEDPQVARRGPRGQAGAANRIPQKRRRAV
jgi:hypothetical protein